MAPPRNVQQRRKKRFMIILVISLALCILIPFGLLTYSTWSGGPSNPPPPSPNDCYTMHTQLSGGESNIVASPLDKQEYIGVSDGSFVFDYLRADGALKCSGALLYRKNDYANAGDLWTKSVLPQDVAGLHYESNDAEALIYRENSRVLSSRKRYVTFIVGTILTGDYNSIGHDVLQGAYIAQQEFNRSKTANKINLQICLWVANFGSAALNYQSGKTSSQQSGNPSSTSVEVGVAQQILDVAKNDSHIQGIVIGLPYTSSQVITLLNDNKANIPLILTGAYSNAQVNGLTNTFPISASTEREAQVGADFVANTLKPNNVAVLVDTSNPYDKSLADAFVQEFATANGGNINSTYQQVCYQKYAQTSGQCKDLQSVLHDLITSPNAPDLIYLAGDAVDADKALATLQNNNTNSAKDVFVMGGDAFYEVSGTNYKKNHYKHLFFTSFSYPDYWNVPNGDLSEWAWQPNSADMGKNKNAYLFPDLYRLTFSGGRLQAYGFSRPDNNAILAFDGVSVLIHGMTIMLYMQENPQAFANSYRPNTLTETLIGRTFAGFTGPISFASTSNNDNVLLLCVGQDGFTREVPTQIDPKTHKEVADISGCV